MQALSYKDYSLPEVTVIPADEIEDPEVDEVTRRRAQKMRARQDLDLESVQDVVCERLKSNAELRSFLEDLLTDPYDLTHIRVHINDALRVVWQIVIEGEIAADDLSGMLDAVDGH